MNTAEPSSPNGCLRKCAAWTGLFVSILYLMNLSGGLIEIPDNLPIVGNLDEVFFSGMLFASLATLGIRIPGFAPKPISPIYEKTTYETNK